MKLYEVYNGNDDTVINESITTEEIKSYFKNIHIIDYEYDENELNRIMNVYDFIKDNLV